MVSDTLGNDPAIYAFEIDDVLYQKRDYILQVFYLFANFLDYTEGTSQASALVEYMKKRYEENGPLDDIVVVTETLAHFGLSDSFLDNYQRLRANATLPLKLYLKPSTKALFKTILAGDKAITILTDGNPVEQLNKLKHIDWEEFSFYLPSLKVYFIQELTFRNINPIDYIGQEYNVRTADIRVIRQLK
ncbi:HAD family hydrolase [Sphingobacterium shayense]|uniref:HAD family hydrolase n=1 Tax=Sphingobacterium shayense TaxID=626343 RepID=UPI0015526470|nr:HAD family hydrolase [Sphingobacterium shayense]NQD69160.1 HAD family hydrolase [Sphingobacterium shayense]